MKSLSIRRSVETERILAKKLPEIIELERLISKLAKFGRVNVEGLIPHKGIDLPIYSLEFGNLDPDAPVIAFVGGVHGLERIGTNIILEYLKTFKELLYWDQMLSFALEQCRIVFYPMVNPAGIFDKSRSNGNGVDLMRNAPIESSGASKFGLVSGHRISNKLPWYRGTGEFERETKLLCQFVERVIFPSPFSIGLDIHSGFGRVDRLWFPYACKPDPYIHFVEMFALKRKLDQALPNHVYKIEPQSHQYLTHGDVWDYLDQEMSAKNPSAVFLPLTLEMGSWQWVKKNPKQILTSLGPFHPVVPHRTNRILRRHITLIDFLIRAVVSHKRWSRPPEKKRANYASDASSLWYGKKPN